MTLILYIVIIALCLRLMWKLFDCIENTYKERKPHYYILTYQYGRVTSQSGIGTMRICSDSSSLSLVDCMLWTTKNNNGEPIFPIFFEEIDKKTYDQYEKYREKLASTKGETT